MCLFRSSVRFPVGSLIKEGDAIRSPLRIFQCISFVFSYSKFFYLLAIILCNFVFFFDPALYHKCFLSQYNLKTSAQLLLMFSHQQNLYPQTNLENKGNKSYQCYWLCEYKFILILQCSCTLVCDHIMVTQQYAFYCLEMHYNYLYTYTHTHI